MTLRRVRLDVGDPPHDYVLGAGVLARLGALLAETCQPCRVALVYDEGVAATGLPDTAFEGLEAHAFRCERIVLPDGEASKTVAEAERLWTRLAESGFERRDVVVALGGGAVGDAAGFCAATYQRGVPLVQAPTTLLAMADSALGGKTGINLSCGKNLVGVIKLPVLVAADLDALTTLSARDIRSGMAEIVKCAVLADRPALSWLAAAAPDVLARDTAALGRAVLLAVETKARHVAGDLHDLSGLRALLNLGHTVAHALETESGHGILRHGEAVSIGMVAAAEVAERRGLSNAQVTSALVLALEAYELPCRLPAGADIGALLRRTRFDKKRRDGRRWMALPLADGGAAMHPVEDDELRAVLAAM